MDHENVYACNRIVCANPWLEYQAQVTLLGFPRKNLWIISIAEVRILSHSAPPTKRGWPLNSPVSSPSSSPTPSTSVIKKLKHESTPATDVRMDNMGHLPHFDDKGFAARYKYPIAIVEHIYIV